MHFSSYLAQFKDFVSYLATVKGDLSSINAPPFLLATKSAIEFPTFWAAHRTLFLLPAIESDPAWRALLVAKNFVCSLKNLVGDGVGDTLKKPLNPFLGELFLATLQSGGTHTRVIAEQVSHHPPVTACFMYDRENGVASNGFASQETSFSPLTGVKVHQVGYAVITDQNHKERHLMTLPTLHVQGLATGKMYSELEGPCYISSSSDYVTTIEFQSKGKLDFSSKSGHGIHASLYHLSDMTKPLYQIKGQWNGKMTIKNSAGESIDVFNVESVPLAELVVKPINKQCSWESRKAWSKVREGILEGDMNKVVMHKTAIEESQRERRRVEESKGEGWKSLFFVKQDKDEDAEALLNAIPDENFATGVDLDRTAGVWKFVGVEIAEQLIQQIQAGSLRETEVVFKP